MNYFNLHSEIPTKNDSNVVYALDNGKLNTLTCPTLPPFGSHAVISSNVVLANQTTAWMLRKISTAGRRMKFT